MKSTKQIKELLAKYSDGKSSLEEEEALKNYFLNNEVPSEFESYKEEFQYYYKFQQLKPGITSRDQFSNGSKKITIPSLVRIAAVISLMIVSFWLGYTVNLKGDLTQKVSSLQNEVNNLKESTVLALLQSNLSHKKIEAMILANQLSSPSEEIISTVLNEFQKVKNPIVQNTALEFLHPHVEKDDVQRILLESLITKDLTTVQIEAFEMLSKSDNPKILKSLLELLDSEKIDNETKDQFRNILLKNQSQSL